jgi:hypothetical protein
MLFNGSSYCVFARGTHYAVDLDVSAAVQVEIVVRREGVGRLTSRFGDRMVAALRRRPYTPC